MCFLAEKNGPRAEIEIVYVSTGSFARIPKTYKTTHF